MAASSPPTDVGPPARAGMPLFALRVAARRLFRDLGFFLFASFSLGIGAGLAALAGAIGLDLLLWPIPYANPDQLWSVRFGLAGLDRSLASGEPLQFSLRLAHEYAETTRDFTAVARLARGLAQVARTPDEPGRQLPVQRVSADYFDVLGLIPAAGRWPRAGRGEIAIGYGLAREWFGSPERALGQILHFDAAAWRVSGVLAMDYLAPIPLVEQRDKAQRRVLVVPTDFATEMARLAVEDQAGQLAIVGRHPGPPRALVAAARRFLAANPVGTFGESRPFVDLVPVEARLFGDEPRTALLMWVAAFVLYATALAGTAMFAAGRHAARRGDHHISCALGAAGWQAHGFDLAEIAILLAVLGILAGVVVVAGAALLDLTPMLRGLVPALPLAKAGLLLLGELALALAVLLIVRQIVLGVTDDESGWRHRRAGSVSRREALAFRLLLGLQVLVGLTSGLLVSGLVEEALAAFRAALGRDFSGLSAVQLRLDVSARPGDVERGLERIRTALAAQPGVRDIALSNASPLDLRGQFLTYFGTDDRGRPIQYSLSIVATEPRLFRLLGYRLRFGRLFAAGERDVAVVTRTAQRAITGRVDQDRIVGFPGPAVDAGDRRWHVGMRIVGGVQDARVAAPGAGRLPFQSHAVVFVPFDVRRLDDRGSVEDAWLVFAGAPPPPAMLHDWVAHSGLPARQWAAQSLAEEVSRRLREHLVASSGVLVLGLVVCLAVLLGTWGMATFIFEKWQAEYGIRVALGATPASLWLRFVLRELVLPVALAGCWLIAMALLAASRPATSGAFTLGSGHALAAALAILITLLAGFALAMRRFRRLSPMAALRGE